MTRKEELIALIRDAQDKYYNGESEVDDSIFDAWWDELKKIDPMNPILHKVGADSGSGFKKVKHIMNMFSQEKANSSEDFRKWFFQNPRTEYIVEYKCDGSSIELQYDKGILIRAVTRGNGTIGDDVSQNIFKAKCVPKELNDKNFSGAVRGEVVLYHDVFDKYYRGKSANCRNAANGIMKRLNSEDAKNLTVVVYDGFKVEGAPFEDEYTKIAWLKANDFNVVDTFFMNNCDDIIQFRDKLSISRFEEIPYDVDGIVVKCPEVDLKDVKRDRPTKQIAFKFILEEVVTDVLDVEWSVSGATRTPVVQVTPVALCGTTVQRASLSNLGIITRLGLKIGSKVMISKHGEIIPHVDRVVYTPKGSKDIPIPSMCEFCGTPLQVSATRVWCPNPNCGETQRFKILNFVNTNNIYHMGPAIVAGLYNSGIVKSIADLYKVTEADLATVIGPKLARKIYDKILNARKLTLSKFIGGFGLEGIGQATIRDLQTKLVPYEGDIYKWLKAIKAKDLIKCRGYERTKSEHIEEQIKSNYDELVYTASLIEVVPDFHSGTALGEISAIIGKKIAITGELRTMVRSEARDKILALGGTISGKVTKNTDYLVANEASNSDKYVTAVKLKVPIITEEQLLELLNTKL